ncbi:MAG: chorismate-binding protein, partial [Balneolaceae bacterium]
MSESYTAIPVSRRMLADVLTPVSVFLSLREQAEYPFLLESVEGGEQLARYSFLGRNPYKVLVFDGEMVSITENGTEEKSDQAYFDVLRDLTTAYREPDLPDLPTLTGGAVGFSSYDTVREIESLSDAPPEDVHLPEAVWAFYDEIIAFDHVRKQLVLMKTVFVKPQMDLEQAFNDARDSLDHLEETVKKAGTGSREFHLDTETVTSNLSESRFAEMVNRGKEYIYEGDIFQVVLSQRFEVPFSGDRFMLYRALRMVNPSPYLFYLDFNGFSLIGSSPEVLVRVRHGKAQLLPIAGTRPRGIDRNQDLALEEELRQDPKEVAEHVMLVDLGRNDLSRVCKAGTVKLERSQAIERYSHVMHIVSDVTGNLKQGMSSVDALMQCFPAGTVSGAPKIRAMQII